jgi:hypothetical protein
MPKAADGLSSPPNPLSGKLPALDQKQALALFRHFVPGCEVDGSIVSGVGRLGTFVVHMEHRGGLRSDTLNRTLRYLGVSRDEFWDWHRDK